MKRGGLYDIAIIGAGASGLLAAIAAARLRPELRVIIVEKNAEPAKKLYATGNGRCNYLNTGLSPEVYSSAELGSAPEIAKTLFHGNAYGVISDFLRGIGIEPKESSEGRVYPRSMQASDVVSALLSAIRSERIELLCGFDAKEIVRVEDSWKLQSAERDYLYARRVIIATGGRAGIQYGCTGEGYRLAQAFGHRIVKPIPALTHLITAEDAGAMAGVRAAGRVSLIKLMGYGSVTAASDSGEIQFTKTGISGICTFNVSRHMRYEDGVSYRAELDLLEEYGEEELNELLLERRTIFAAEAPEAIISGLLPRKAAQYIVNRAGCLPRERCRDLDRDRVRRIAQLCKKLSFTVTGTGSWKDAQVTSGGVSLTEVDPAELSSRLAKHIYFCGEVLDVDAPCGGFNLGFAFASGMTAGLSAAASV